MSVLEGLAAYKARKEAEQERRDAASRPNIRRFALEKSGDSAIVRFAQEIDFDAKNFSDDLGVGFINIEHNHPDPNRGWMNRANCSTESQGQCLPCERVANRDVEWSDRKGWKQKEKFYINVIAGEPREVVKPKKGGGEKKHYFTTDIDRETGDGEVYLLEQGTYNGIYDDLVNYFLEEEVSGNSITDKYFKIVRKGSEFNDTSYSITALKELPADAKPLSEFELYNIKEDVLTEVPYNQQAAFYSRGIDAEPVVEEKSKKSESDEDVW